VLRDEVAGAVADPSDVDGEMRAVIAALATAQFLGGFLATKVSTFLTKRRGTNTPNKLPRCGPLWLKAVPPAFAAVACGH
jgi:hypothetical protein